MSLWPVLLVIALLMLLGFALLFWWLRSRGARAVRALYLTVRQMEQDHGVSDRYGFPWYLLLGDPALGQGLCPAWNLNAVGPAAWFGRWWADQDGAVLAVPQALFLPEEGSPPTLLQWRRLLSLLVRLRPRRPLDGVIWNIPAQRLLEPLFWSHDSLLLKRRFNDLLQRLGLSLPVYVVVSGLEQLPGFEALLEALPEQARQRNLGWTSAVPVDLVWQTEVVDAGFDSVLQSLQAVVLEAAVLNGRLDNDLHGFPRELEALRDGLRLRLELAFQGNSLGEAARLRGLYFTGRQHQVAAPDAPEPPPGVAAPQVFCQRLWQERLLAEQGLARAVPRILRLRLRSQWLVAMGAAALACVWLLGMLWVWHDSTRDARILVQGVQTLQRGSDLTERQRLQAYWRLLQDAPRWHYRSLLYPGSWFSGFDDEMDRLVRGLALNQALLPLHRLLRDDFAQLQRIGQDGPAAHTAHDSPERWPAFVDSRRLADGLVRLERRNDWYAAVRNGTPAPLETLMLLANDRLALDLQVSARPGMAHFDSALAAGVPEAPPGIAMEKSAAIIEGHFRELMWQWLDQYFMADAVVRPASYLRLQLAQLGNGQGRKPAELEEIQALIESLRRALEQGNVSSNNDGGLVPGYRELLESVGQSRLLGKDMANALVAEAEQLRRSFQARWIAPAGLRNDNLLQQQSNGTLLLQEHVAGLGSAIDGLLREDFVVMAYRHHDQDFDPSGLVHLDARSINAALAHYQDFLGYLSQAQGSMPADYRQALIRSAESAAAVAMWSRLAGHRGSNREVPMGRGFDVPVEAARQVRQAFEVLGREHLAQALEGHLTALALDDIAAALVEIDRLPLMHERSKVSDWQGGPNLGLQFYRSTDIQDLKQTLARQFEIMLAVTESHAPALAWLNGNDNLGYSERDQVLRLYGLSEEMARYKMQNPASAPALLEQMLSRDFMQMDSANCGQVLATSMLPPGQGELSRHIRNLHGQAQRRCQALQQRLAGDAWDAIVEYFQRHLAGRFPFSHDPRAEDADPQKARHFIGLLEKNLAVARTGLQSSTSLEQLDFLDRLQSAQALLAAILDERATGKGLEVEVHWRTEREYERGAEQVIRWALHVADRQIDYPGDGGQRLQWRVGEPVRLVLRWASGSLLRPAIDTRQAGMAVAGLEAGWQYSGPWALLRMMNAHAVTPDAATADERSLLLQVPVREADRAPSTARMFLRLVLAEQGTGATLSLPELSVPASRPYAANGNSPWESP
ncbi:type VI secretion system protein ImpL [Stutzerimonas kirkiae]|uniref:Type VI secretion system protein ImpL n=1 Tax=Stutzerimonas kirkiae TaxID=2211392 RepID=A0A4Q9QZU0_9GAMM|nr:type VI secretion protein IcmF/TssM N-terminal domain-containing protein [Stutzerimonas kirkiae]TBU91635.1 type VI secretion system protein ImpL [Stutzerimonas kirkiae]TBV00639.1 type VI secretion system protein ImpL [Stutzerimonas kirkiae]